MSCSSFSGMGFAMIELLRIGIYAQLKHAYAQLSMLCAVNVAHKVLRNVVRRPEMARRRGLLDGSHHRWDAVQGFIYAVRHADRRPPRQLLVCHALAPIGHPRLSQSYRLKGRWRGSVGGLLGLGKRVGQDIRSKPASSICKWLTFLVLFCARGIQEK